MACHQPRSAFTLIELSIVLIIIGLLVGGVLAGRDLIAQAKLNSVIQEVRAFDTARKTFQVKYDGYPGDFDNASAYSIGSDGDGNGQVALNSTEIVYHWDHLANAGLIDGTFTGAYADPVLPGEEAPGTALGGDSVYWFYYVSTPDNHFYSGANDIYERTGHMLGAARTNETEGGNGEPSMGIISADSAYTIDTKIDDGGASSGNVMVFRPHDGDDYIDGVCLGGSTAGSLFSSGTSGQYDYNLGEEGDNCRLMFFE